MSLNLEAFFWPNIYLFLGVGAIFACWAMILYKKKRTDWKDLLVVAVICFAVAVMMVAMHYVGQQLSMTVRFGLVSIILILYACYSYRRPKNNG